MTNEALTAGDRLKGELQRAVERIRLDLDKVELLSVAMNAFSAPVPDYEPRFRHVQHMTSNAQEFTSRR